MSPHPTDPGRRGLTMWAALLIGSALGLQATLLFVLHHAGPSDLPALAWATPFVPLLYVCAFNGWRRGAVWLSWSHYLGLVAQLLIAWPATRTEPLAHALIEQMLLSTALSHPLYILVLSCVLPAQRPHQPDQDRLARYRDKARFLAMLSHEIRTPLQSMLGSIDLLDMRLSGPTEQRAVARLRTAADQLQAQLRDLSEYTRLEDPALSIQHQPIDLVQLLQDLVEEYRPSVQTKGLTLHLELAEQEAPQWRQAQGDPGRLRQILTNLLSNAIKYTESGHITVRVKIDPVQVGQVCFCVEDTGIGMAEEHLQTIFTPFVRLEQAQSRQTEGTGLGLAVVQRLVERLHGTIHVTSTPGLGSCFEVCLPMIDNA